MHENREISGASRSKQDRDRSAKAQSHNADMHDPEKSDRVIVPMNQPNKGESFPAEVGEGSARTKENIVWSNTSPTQSGERVSQGLSGVRRAAKERRQERFYRTASPSECWSAPGELLRAKAASRSGSGWRDMEEV